MQVNINLSDIAKAISQKEIAQDAVGESGANHQLANIISALDDFTDIDALKTFIVTYGLWVLDIGANPFDNDGCWNCFGAPMPGTICGECGLNNGT